jgi:exonuclease SbcD
MDDIHARLEKLKKEESTAWLEIEYTGSDIISNLRETLDEALVDTTMEIIRIRNRRVMDRVISSIAEDETLDDLDSGDVFTRCMDAFEVPADDRDELTATYNEIIQSINENDVNAE